MWVEPGDASPNRRRCRVPQPTSPGPLRRALQRLRAPHPLGVFYHPGYRLPLTTLESQAAVEPRRADFVAWYLSQNGLVAETALRRPAQVAFPDLARVHTEAYLSSLEAPETLARIFAADPAEIPLDEVLTTMRLACGGTLEAARVTLKTRVPQLNLLGGFHHAAPGRGGGFCCFNDVAVAIAAVRADGFQGQVLVLDLDAHPPDGTAACVAGDERVFIASLSASDWGPLPPRVDETVLPAGTGDVAYGAALGALLARVASRRERPGLAFVLAGGDVLAGDRLGLLALGLGGARARDVQVARALAGVPQVWLPAGGYQLTAWRVLAGSALVLLGRPGKAISPREDPLARRFDEISGTLPSTALSGSDELLSQEDLDDLFGGHGVRHFRLLGFYTAQGLEYGLYRYGFFEQLTRLGYAELQVQIDGTSTGDRMRLTGVAEGARLLLAEIVFERKRYRDAEVLFINWLSLRHPRAKFSEQRPQLPGQDVPGLGMVRETAEVFERMVARLKLAGVVFRPSWFHMAYAARKSFSFVNAERQGRFEALLRDTRARPLLEVTRGVAEGRMVLNGSPYAWEPDEMAHGLAPESEAWRAEVIRTREASRFTLRPT